VAVAPYTDKIIKKHLTVLERGIKFARYIILLSQLSETSCTIYTKRKTDISEKGSALKTFKDWFPLSNSNYHNCDSWPHAMAFAQYLIGKNFVG